MVGLSAISVVWERPSLAQPVGIRGIGQGLETLAGTLLIIGFGLWGTSCNGSSADHRTKEYPAAAAQPRRRWDRISLSRCGK